LRNFYSILLVFILINQHFFGQILQSNIHYSEPYFRHFGIKEGLPSNEVYYVHQDEQSYLWLCTDNGVSKFDGQSFINYNEKQGLCSNVIFGCRQDLNGLLWFYSFTGELSYYNVSLNQFECPEFNEALSLALHGKKIQDLIFCGDTIYVCTADRYAKVLHNKNRSAFVSIHEVKNGQLEAIALTNGQIIALSGINGDAKFYDFVFKNKNTITLKNLAIKGRIAYTFSFKLHKKLFVFFGENVLVFDTLKKTGISIKLPFIHTPGIKNTDSGFLCGSYNNGLWDIDIRTDELKFTQLLKSKNISSSIQDRQGGIWAASHTDGLYYIPSKHTLTFGHLSENESNKISSVYTKGELIYYTTYEGDLYKINLQEVVSQEFICNLGSYSPVIKALQDNKLYFHKEHKLHSVNLITKEILNQGSTSEFCLLNQINNQAYIYLLKDSLRIMDCRTKFSQQKNFVLPWKGGRIITQYIINEDNIWLGSIFDAYILKPSTGAIKSIGKQNGLHRLYCKQIIPIAKDTVLIAGGQGLLLCHHEKIIKTINSTNGLSSDKVLSVAKDGNSLWIGTSQGLDKIENICGVAPKIVSINKLMGFSPNQVSHVVISGKHLIAGTNQGILLLNKNESLFNGYEPEVKITGIQINNSTELNHNLQSLGLRSDENSLTVSFVAFNFRNSLNNKYRYRLNTKSTKDWSFTNQTMVFLPLLQPGHYVFEIQIMSPTGDWSSKSGKLSFTIDRPYYQSTWFVMLMLFIIGIIVYIIFKLRVKRLKDLNTLNNRLIEMRLQTLGLQLSPHFVFNALNSVSHHMARNDSKSTLKFLGKFAKLMRLIFKHSQTTLIPLSEELKALAIYMELETVRLGFNFNYKVTIGKGINANECLIPTLLLQPLIENAIWHGIGSLPEGGKIDLHFEQQTNNLMITLIDNGVGREKARLQKAEKIKEKHSLDLIRERLALLKQHYKSEAGIIIENDTDNKECCGTRVTITLPLLYESI